MIDTRLPESRLMKTKATRCVTCMGRKRRQLPSVPPPKRIHWNISWRYSGPLNTRGGKPSVVGHRARLTVPKTASARGKMSISRIAPRRSPERRRRAMIHQAGSGVQQGQEKPRIESEPDRVGESDRADQQDRVTADRRLGHAQALLTGRRSKWTMDANSWKRSLISSCFRVRRRSTPKSSQQNDATVDPMMTA